MKTCLILQRAETYIFKEFNKSQTGKSCSCLVIGEVERKKLLKFKEKEKLVKATSERQYIS